MRFRNIRGLAARSVRQFAKRPSMALNPTNEIKIWEVNPAAEASRDYWPFLRRPAWPERNFLFSWRSNYRNQASCSGARRFDATFQITSRHPTSSQALHRLEASISIR